MPDLFWLPKAQIERISRYFPRSHGGHWQVVWQEGEFGHVTEGAVGSGCRLGTRFLPPDTEGLVPGTAVLAGRHEVPARTEMAVDHAVG